ncbi:MAG: hypothetical protein QW348_01640 [Ignisphaera sp.]
MAIRRSKATQIVVLVSTLLGIGVAGMLLVLEGFVPWATANIDLETPLYPYNYTYIFTINAFLGRGTYLVSINPRTQIEACISCDEQAVQIKALGGETKTATLYCDSGNLNIFVKAYVEPYTTSAGDLTVVRKWR